MRILGPVSTEWSRTHQNVSPRFMGDIYGDFDYVVENLLSPRYFGSEVIPVACDVNETKDHYLMSFDLPGVKKEDIHIEFQQNQLVISGQRQSTFVQDKEDSVLRNEKHYGRFERAFTVPSSIASDRVEAHYEDGVLNVVLPKAESAKTRTVQIQSGQSGFFKRFLSSKNESTKEIKDIKN